MATGAGAAETDEAKLWQAARLRYLMHDGQKHLYAVHSAWQQQSIAARKAGQKQPGRWPRIFMTNCSRRWGKDHYSILVMFIKALKKPDQILFYATAHQSDVISVAIPLAEKILQHCPEYLRPEYRTSHQGQAPGYYFKNGSVVRFIGIDRNPDSARGRYCNGIVISEAGFVDKLEYFVETVMYPQMQGDLEADIIMNSTPSEEPAHPYLERYMPDCQENGRYFTRTIEDNPLLTDSEREEYIEAAGGRESEKCRREYFCEIIRSTRLVVIPEFSRARHIRDNATPPYANGITVIDPGSQDMCAVLCGYWDFERGVLVIRTDWAAAGSTTAEIVDAVRNCERRAFVGIGAWKDDSVVVNPVSRRSDTDLRLIIDMNREYKLSITAAEKTGAEAALQSMRVGFAKGQIEIHPEAATTIKHVESAIYNANRTSYARQAGFGHFDAVDALKYMWRHVDKITDPRPPEGYLRYINAANVENLHVLSSHLKKGNTVRDIAAKLYKERGWSPGVTWKR